jgi:hypothetical protein
MILEGHGKVKDLFEFVINNADAMDAYSIEKEIFSRLMGIGLALPFTQKICLDFEYSMLYILQAWKHKIKSNGHCRDQNPLSIF